MSHGAATAAGVLLGAAVVVLAGAIIAVPPAGAGAQVKYRGTELRSDPLHPDSSAPISAYILEHIDEVATPEFRRRKAERRGFQRAGYAHVLHDALSLDAAGALVAFFRMRLQLEYSLPQNTIYLRDDAGVLWPLPEDRAFPEDPWGK